VEGLLLLRSIVGSALSPAPPVWDTEWGYSSTWYGDGHAAATRKQQAVFAVRECLSAWAVGFPLAVYYDLRDDGTDGANGEHNFGLIQNDYSDKPAVVAVRTLSAAAKGRSFAGFSSLVPSSLHAMRLDAQDGSRTFVLWSDAPSGALTVSLSGNPTVTDAFGLAVTPSRTTPASVDVALRGADGPLYVAYPPNHAADAGVTATDAGVTATDASVTATDAGSSSAGGTSGTPPGGAGGTFANMGGAAASGGAAGGASGSSNAAAGSGDSAGCGCRAAARSGPGELTTMVVAVAALGGLFRRRRQR